VQGEKVTVTWRTGAMRTSAHYLCQRAFTNRYVVGHAKILLRDTLNAEDVTFNRLFTRERQESHF
jgi:hypothetical protein